MIDCIAIDGDTIRCNNEHIRLVGVNSPELHGHCHAAAERARTFTMARLHAASVVSIDRFGTDQYGRTLAVVRVDGIILAEWIISEHHGEPYGSTTRRTRVGQRSPDRC